MFHCIHITASLVGPKKRLFGALRDNRVICGPTAAYVYDSPLSVSSNASGRTVSLQAPPPVENPNREIFGFDWGHGDMSGNVAFLLNRGTLNLYDHISGRP